MTSEGSYTLILPFTSKTGQSIAQNSKRFFNLCFTSKERTYLAFYRPDFRLHIGIYMDKHDLKGTRDRTKRTGIYALFH